MSILCKIKHKWRLSSTIKSSLNRYYECERCGKRTVVYAQYGYQPVNQGRGGGKGKGQVPPKR